MLFWAVSILDCSPSPSKDSTMEWSCLFLSVRCFWKFRFFLILEEYSKKSFKRDFKKWVCLLRGDQSYLRKTSACDSALASLDWFKRNPLFQIENSWLYSENLKILSQKIESICNLVLEVAKLDRQRSKCSVPCLMRVRYPASVAKKRRVGLHLCKRNMMNSDDLIKEEQCFKDLAIKSYWLRGGVPELV